MNENVLFSDSYADVCTKLQPYAPDLSRRRSVVVDNELYFIDLKNRCCPICRYSPGVELLESRVARWSEKWLRDRLARGPRPVILLQLELAYKEEGSMSRWFVWSDIEAAARGLSIIRTESKNSWGEIWTLPVEPQGHERQLLEEV